VDITPYQHTHFAFEIVAKRIDQKNPRYFDYQGVHPHIQKINSPKHAEIIFTKYHRKAPVQLTQVPAEWRSKSIDRIIKESRTLYEAVEAAGVSIQSVADVKAIRNDRPRAKPFEHIFDPASFWLQVPDPNWRVLYIWGPTGTGKYTPTLQ